ncbi:MAG: hypothetical protein K2K97_11395, partial [Muribaculaceae bacterium]|nr:hypothetical protein [Muribaculaceae bacterium]
IKTKTTWDALQVAITAAETAVKATAESLTIAKNNLNGAIKGLALIDNYSNLTPEMYKKYASVSEPGEGENAADACAYVLFEGSGMPYGDGNVSELLWADLSSYEKLILTTVGETRPRFMMNRLEPDGQQAPTKEDSKLVDINSNNGIMWSAEAYQTVEDNIYTIDLKKVVSDYGFARLHSIKKQGYGPDVFVTGMYLYQDPGSSEAELLEGATVVRSDVYTMSGVRVLTDASLEEISNRLPKGIYIHNGKKIYLK